MKNVILLTLDATRKDVFGVYGSKRGLTPFIDTLKDKSIIYTRGQTTGPYTQASFPGILTSSHYLEYGKPMGLAPERTLISEPLQKAGITTAAFHSNPYICGYFGWNRGWSVFYDSMDDDVEPRIPYVRGNVINTKVINWLSSHCKSGKYNPFFLWLHYMDVHEPYMPEKKYIDIIDPAITISQDEMYHLFENTLLKRDVSNRENITLLRRLYDVHVREVDTYVQEFFNALEKFNILNDSIVIITNDHGDEFCEHAGLSHDDKMYSELIDSPLIIYDPDRDMGEVCDALVSNIDIPPTVTYLFGLEAIAGFEGHSLLPLKNISLEGVFGEAFDQRSQKGGDIEKDIYFYREGDLKIIYRANLDTWEMYDLNKDPEEVNNIITVSPHVDKLKGKLKPRVRRWKVTKEDG